MIGFADETVRVIKPIVKIPLKYLGVLSLAKYL